MKKDNVTGERLSYSETNLIALKQTPSKRNFKEYLFEENKIYSLLMIFLMICQFIVFKLCYPYPDFFSDSYSYILAAAAHLDVNIWPIGYSKFLSVFHWFSHSATSLNFFQYMFLGIAGLYFYHTIIYFYSTGKNTRMFLCLFLFFNPLSLYLANYVSSDAIFVALSMIWITQLIWVIQRPHPYQILVISIVIFIAFTFRYNAALYPIITAMTFILSRQKLWVRLAGIVAGPLLIIPFIIFSSNAAKKMTGTAQFPPILGGWQWGNNALYMRGFIDVDSTKLPSPETAELDRVARKYFSQPSRPQNDLSSYVANYFIREPEAPLKQYMLAHYTIKDQIGQVVAWGKAAPIFGQYGTYLIKHYPIAFARYYLLVNTKNYFLPPLEKLEVYNLGKDDIWPLAATWFGFQKPLIHANVSYSLQGIILMFLTPLFLILNGYYLYNLYRFIRQKGYRKVNKKTATTIFLISTFLFLNLFFSIFANIIVIRYQIYPMIIFLTFSMMLTDLLDLQAATKKPVQGWDGVDSRETLVNQWEPHVS